MLFELYNASNTFQFFINVTLYKYLNDFCINYMNNILIYSKTQKKHMFHVFKILKQLQKTNLFLNINKCEFFVTKIKYLKFIITIENVKINLTKIEMIVNWFEFRNLKNVQIFFEFVNFYRKFILNYFQIASFLIKFTKTKKKNLNIFEIQKGRNKKFSKRSKKFSQQRLF